MLKNGASKCWAGPRPPAMSSAVASALHGLVGPLVGLDRRLVVCEPCAGISAWKAICDSVGLVWSPEDCYEFDAALGAFWRKHLGTRAQSMHLDEAGDINFINCNDLQSDVEVLVAGPPCQPWSPSGKRGGEYDDRSLVYLQVISMIVHYAHKGSLLFFLVENSSLLAKSAFLRDVMQYLSAALPWFVVDYVKQDLQAVFPHSRSRVWLRGLRRDCCKQNIIPQPVRDPWKLAGCPKPSLRSLLMQGIGNKDPGLLSAKQQHNLQRYKGFVKQDLLDGHGFEIAVLELDRAPGKLWGSRYFRDVCPALRSSGGSLFVLSTGDLDQEWWEQEFHRPLTAQERLVLQGHSRELYYDFYRSSDCAKATGNAFHTLALAMMMQPLCQAALDAGKLQSSNQQAPLQPNEIATLCRVADAGTQAFKKLRRK